MGRHRSDPRGIARIAFIGLAAVALVVLLVIGARALLSAVTADSDPTTAATLSVASDPPSDPGTPTLRVICQAERCPVFVRVPGGDILIDRDLSQGEQASYFEPELDVVIGEPSTVQVFVNGSLRPPGGAGKRESFEVTRDPGQ